MYTPDSLTQEQPVPLDVPRLRRTLAHAPIGHTIDYARLLPSTMPVAAARIREPAARSGLIVVAEEQSAGRGRQARLWHAPPATALLVSIALKPPELRLPPSHLPMAAGLAALDAAAATIPTRAQRLHLKWPNDLTLGDTPQQARKLGGILVQTALSPQGELLYAVIGIGLNANQTADQLPSVAPPAPPPTSLRLAQGAPVDRTDLLIALCHALATHLDRAPTALLDAWRAHLSTLNQRVALYASGSDSPTLIGYALDVDATGALQIQDDTGRVHTVHAGDVSLRLAE